VISVACILAMTQLRHFRSGWTRQR